MKLHHTLIRFVSIKVNFNKCISKIQSIDGIKATIIINTKFKAAKMQNVSLRTCPATKVFLKTS